MPQDKRTDMVSLATEGDRTLFFDFLPLNLGDIKGFKTRFQLYTVPGQVYYNSTRKLVLRGVDGIVFVADSQRSRQAENLESLQNLRQNLQDYGIDLDDMPFVLQYNKRDMENVFSLEELNAELNPRNVPFFPATAHNGKGVVTTLKTIAMLVIEKFNVKQGFLRKAAESVNNTGVHDVSLTKEGVSVKQAAPKPQVQPEALRSRCLLLRRDRLQGRFRPVMPVRACSRRGRLLRRSAARVPPPRFPVCRLLDVRWKSLRNLETTKSNCVLMFLRRSRGVFYERFCDLFR